MAWYSILDPAYLEPNPEIPPDYAGTVTAGRWESSPDPEPVVPNLIGGSANAVTVPSLFETVYPTLVRVTWESDWNPNPNSGYDDQMMFGLRGEFANGTDGGETAPYDYIKQQLEPVVDPVPGGYFVSGGGGSGGPGTYVIELNTEPYDPLLIRLTGVSFSTWHNQFVITALEIDVPPGDPPTLSQFWTGFVKTREVPR